MRVTLALLAIPLATLVNAAPIKQYRLQHAVLPHFQPITFSLPAQHSPMKNPCNKCRSCPTVKPSPSDPDSEWSIPPPLQIFEIATISILFLGAAYMIGREDHDDGFSSEEAIMEMQARQAFNEAETKLFGGIVDAEERYIELFGVLHRKELSREKTLWVAERFEKIGAEYEEIIEETKEAS